MGVGQLRWQCYRRHQQNPKPCPDSVVLSRRGKKEEYAKLRTKGRGMSYGKIVLTTVAVTQDLQSWMPLVKGKKGSLLWPGASQWRIYYHRMWGQLSTTCSNVLKQPTGELLVAVNHNQLRTVASETVDPIHWSHPTPSWAVPPERLVHSINQCNCSGNRTCNRSGNRTCNRSMRGNHLAYAATQGIEERNS